MTMNKKIKNKISDKIFEATLHKDNDLRTENIIIIDDTYKSKGKTYTITKMVDYCFSDFENLEEIILPNTLTEISKKAFSNCPFLKEVHMFDNIKIIRSDAFMECKSLEEIIIPEGVTIIESGAFLGCSNLKKVILPKTLTTIGANAFMGCKSLEEIIIPKNVYKIGDNAFNGVQKIYYNGSCTSENPYFPWGAVEWIKDYPENKKENNNKYSNNNEYSNNNDNNPGCASSSLLISAVIGGLGYLLYQILSKFYLN